MSCGCGVSGSDLMVCVLDWRGGWIWEVQRLECGGGGPGTTLTSIILLVLHILFIINLSFYFCVWTLIPSVGSCCAVFGPLAKPSFTRRAMLVYHHRLVCFASSHFYTAYSCIWKRVDKTSLSPAGVDRPASLNHLGWTQPHILAFVKSLILAQFWNPPTRLRIQNIMWRSHLIIRSG